MESPSGNKTILQQTEKQFALIMLGFALLMGSFVRLYPMIKTGFPVNDGGLFFKMIQDLQQAGYQLPFVTTYNHLDIPFAYPPFPLYFVAILNQISKVPLLALVGWLPAIISILSMAAFYLLARKLLDNEFQAALAAMFFALLPHSFEWQIMGGGVTRAFGGLFYILFSYCTYRTFWEKKGNIIPAIITGSLLVLSHPEWTLHGIVTAGYFWWTKGRNKPGILKALLLAGSVALLTALWWLDVILRHGIQVFLAAPKASGTHLLFWVPLLLLNFTGESVPFTALLGIIGAIYLLHKKQPFLAIWFLLVFLTDPRSSLNVAPIQVSLLAAIAFSEIFRPWLAIETADKNVVSEKRLKNKTRIPLGLVVLGYFSILGLVNAQLCSLKLVDNSVLSQAERQALTWVSNNTPSSSRFLVMTWQEDASISPILEWFPALTGRVSISTVQGREWLPGIQNFTARWLYFPDLQECLYKDLPCVNAWLTKMEEAPINYLLFTLSSPTDAGEQERSSSLLVSVQQSKNYGLVYDSPDVVIYQRLH